MSDIKPTAWRSHDCARAITNRELANVPDENGRRDRCASLYPVPLYEKDALAEARKAAFIEAAEIAAGCEITMPLIPGGPDGASIAKRLIYAVLIAKAEETRT